MTRREVRHRGPRSCGARQRSTRSHVPLRVHEGESRYSLTVNTDRKIVKLLERQPPHKLTTFRILKVSADCGKYGWELNNATFCTATQGVGTLDWNGREFDCIQADTE
jgi:hypothetical protein